MLGNRSADRRRGDLTAADLKCVVKGKHKVNRTKNSGTKHCKQENVEHIAYCFLGVVAVDTSIFVTWWYIGSIGRNNAVHAEQVAAEVTLLYTE